MFNSGNSQLNCGSRFNSELTTRNISLKTCNLQLRSNLQLLCRYSFNVFMVRCFFLLSHFLEVLDYELSKRHLVSMAWTLECARILYCSIYFYVINVFIRLLSELMIMLLTHHVTKHMTCRNKLRYPMSCNLILLIEFVGRYFHFSSATL